MKPPKLRVDGTCAVCGNGVRMGVTSWYKNPARVCYYHECRECGFLRILENNWDYASEGFTVSSSVGPRVGQEDRQGREFHMASLGIEMLDRFDIDVLILGAGKSLDWKHIAARPEVRSVTTSDLENFNGSPNFVELDGRGDKTYDLVLACEVAEHFTEPAEHMAQLCNDVSPDGLAVLSTNIYDGSDLARHWYVYIPGHVSYYTPDAILALADQNGMEADFRVPRVGMQTAGPRKRYVLMSRDQAVMNRAGAFFAAKRYAPSEDDPKVATGP